MHLFEYQELKKDKLITLDKTSQSRFFIVEWFRKRGITIDIAMELGSIEMVKRYVEMDLGFSIVPPFYLTENKYQRGSYETHSYTFFILNIFLFDYGFRKTSRKFKRSDGKSF